MALFTNGGISSGEWGGFFSGMGNAVNDLMSVGAYKKSAEGDIAQANDFLKAKKIAEDNINIVKASGELQQGQEDRKILATEGVASAGEGKAEVTGGSAGDILRSSMQQGSLAKALISQHENIQEQAWKEKAQAYQTQVDAANSAAETAMQQASNAGIAGIMSGVTGVLGLFL